MINDWITSFEYNYKRMAVVNWIKIPKNTVLWKIGYTDLKPYHNFGPLSFYSTANYEWLHMYYDNTHTGFGPTTNLTKTNVAWAD